jgi:hypothetical protein
MEKRLYITTNLINGKVYAGKHHWKDGSTYMGSGYALKKAFEKYGKENFEIRWLRLKINTPEDLDRLEIRLIRLLKYRYGNKCYNIQKGGCGGYFSFYMSDEEKKEVYKKISESKKRQYAKGLTPKQIIGRKIAREKIIQNLKDDTIYNNVFVAGTKKRVESLKERRLSQGATQRELDRQNKLPSFSIKHITYQLSFPNQTQKIETMTVKDFMSQYKTDWNIFSVAREQGQFIFKRRTARTKHPFPENTILTIISEVKDCDL